jgi:hypothetical protein
VGKAGLALQSILWLPCSSETKKPDPRLLPQDEAGKAVWGPYQECPADEGTVKGWFARGCQSVAAIGGKVSGGLLVIDFDEARFYEVWKAEVGGLHEAEGLAELQSAVTV